MTPEELRLRGERMSEALSREAYEAGAGLKVETAFERIFAEYADCAGEDAWQAARGVGALEEWAADNRIGRSVAGLEDRLHAWESQAVLALENGEAIPYQQAGIVIANEPRRERRLAIDRARRKILGTPAGMREERLDCERQILHELLGLDVVAARTRLSGMPLAKVAGQCRDFLDHTRDMYREVLGEFLKAELGMAPGEADRTDGSYLFRGKQYDEFFPGGDLTAIARKQVGEMGLDAEAAGRIRYDTGEREHKRARAFCAPVRVPDEVYLVTRPHGGYTDYRAFWHELGHALHFANTSRDLPFEARWAGDNSVTECFAMLFEHQTMAPGWLKRYTGMQGRTLEAFLRAQAFGLLAIVRRYAAKLNYELELHAAPAKAPERYVEWLTTATGFRYSPEDALLDLDDAFYSARYLRAWQLESALRERMIEQFDEDWFRNPKSGPFLLGLFEPGQRDNATQLASRALGIELGFGAVAAWCERMLS